MSCSSSNHVTWLDILALGGATRALFVSRDDVEHWPVVGWIAGLNDTIYVARHARREVHGQADQLRRALAAGRAVALFPEGTTSLDGLPFRPSLFASVFPPLDRVKVQPVAIDYGPLADEIAWVGEEPAGVNAKRVVSRKGTIPVTLALPRAGRPARGRRPQDAGRPVAGRDRRGAGRFRTGVPTPYMARNEEQGSPDLPGQVVRLPDERL